MSTTPDPAAGFRQSEHIDLDELFRNAPVLTTPHDLAAPEIFPTDAEFEEFLASLRTDRPRPCLIDSACWCLGSCSTLTSPCTHARR